MDKCAVLTGDISNFTKLTEKERLKLINDTEKLIKSWVKRPNLAEVFRGDSYQLMIEDTTDAIKKSMQLICWFKKYHDNENKISLSTRIAIGIGNIAYNGRSVLDSDGEAFHLSGRNFDKMSTPEVLRIKTADDAVNKPIAIIITFVNLLINQWTPGQAEVIYLAINGDTQTVMAEKLAISQGSVNNRLRLANWKVIQEGIDYIINLITTNTDQPEI